MQELGADPRPAYVLGYNFALVRRDGGGQRVDAFLRALRACTPDVKFVGVGPRETEDLRERSSSLPHRIKRRFLPVPLRGGPEAELADYDLGGPTVSLVPALNRTALKSAGPHWLDFPDLWSDIASNHAATVDPVSAACNRAQGWLWSRREADEYARAEVVTTASLSDSKRLGPNAVWLPTPMTDAIPRHRRPPVAPEAGIVYGLLANFDYPPNLDAYHRLIRDWLPRHRLPAVRKVIVAGFGSERLTEAPDVEIIGPLDAVGDFYDRIAVALAPIDQGGGMKVKVVEAMMYGRPVIASAHARVGLPQALTDACFDVDDVQVARREGNGLLGDPRSNSAVATELERFTFKHFQHTVKRLWQDRIANRRSGR